MDQLTWIKDLVREEQQMEESGMVDFSLGFDPDKHLFSETIHYLDDVKSTLVQAATSFNQMKGTNLGRVKIYGISNTHADFMLFRNGFKLIFSMKEPGVISIRYQYAGANFAPQQSSEDKPETAQEDLLYARWGPFGDLIWTFQEQAIKLDYLVRYYLSRFIRESSK